MSSATTTSTQAISGIPRNLVRPKSMTGCGMPLMIDSPLVYQSTKPRMMAAVPSVMMNGSTRSVVVSHPFMPPTAAPSATPKSKPSTSGKCQCENAAAVITELRPQMLPIDRSKLPDTSVSKMPRVRTPVTDWLDRMFCQLAAVLNVADVVDHKL